MATLKTLVSFSGSNGKDLYTGVLIDSAGDVFGTTVGGGADGDGTVFEIVDTNGTYASAPATLVNFDGMDGIAPRGNLIADAAGDLFGTTIGGGSSNDGTAFEIVRNNGTYASAPTILADFNGANGANPYGGLIADAAGNLFGTTMEGGTTNQGTVFEIVKNNGTYATTPTTLVNFSRNFPTSGLAYPEGNLVADAAGDLFGIVNGPGRWL